MSKGVLGVLIFVGIVGLLWLINLIMDKLMKKEKGEKK